MRRTTRSRHIRDVCSVKAAEPEKEMQGTCTYSRQRNTHIQQTKAPGSEEQESLRLGTARSAISIVCIGEQIEKVN
jgi:hypothetical protein